MSCAAPIAEQLSQFLLVISNAVLRDQRNEIRRRVACQRRLAEVRIGGKKILRAAMQIGEVAAPAAGDQDLLADAIGVLEHGNSAAALARLDGAHQAGSAAAQDDYIEAVFEQVTSFRVWGGSCKLRNWRNESKNGSLARLNIT